MEYVSGNARLKWLKRWFGLPYNILKQRKLPKVCIQVKGKYPNTNLEFADICGMFKSMELVTEMDELFNDYRGQFPNSTAESIESFPYQQT
ncbi:hypothetical protein CDAR_75261 [Caerostris darwini]|uniref:Uncharacterized protein n=1 Tax=Caerostris darwini TaxID=1538125 RepID=A0AAV4QS77_9ARAC|nr:hypothetical protein CDAR_75261 [Caerostris darwini]